MGLHVKLSPEAEAELSRQRRNSSIASLLVGLLLMALLATVFYLLSITLFNSTTEPFVAYNDDSQEEKELEKEKVVTQMVKRTPSSSSSATSPVIAVNVPTASFSVPEVEVEVEVETLTAAFGSTDGFGDGFGSGPGFGGDGNGADGGFFGVSTGGSGDKVVFVIDYSKSMDGQKITLLRNELVRAIEEMPEGLQFELLFFAGPAWLGGSSISGPANGAGKYVATNEKGDKFVWSTKGKGKVAAGNFNPVGETQKPKYDKLSESSRKENIEAVLKTPLVWGTDWGSPLDLVFEMRDKPDTVIFLTDGVFTPAGSSMNAFVEKYAAEAKRHNITINAISLLEPAARAAMERLAEITGGEFGMINAKGEREDLKEKGGPVKQHKGYK